MVSIDMEEVSSVAMLSRVSKSPVLLYSPMETPSGLVSLEPAGAVEDVGYGGVLEDESRRARSRIRAFSDTLEEAAGDGLAICRNNVVAVLSFSSSASSLLSILLWWSYERDWLPLARACGNIHKHGVGLPVSGDAAVRYPTS